ncbi:MAG: hypothetical protein HY360_21710 [Verrucomicrobia bacterium]|nr:hypothetical protein [Verrucomicrobiota bacterium]
MTIYLRDLLEKPELLEDLCSDQQKCSGCGIMLQETITGKRQTPGGYACSDCYYEQLGEEIERRPIASAGIRRG